MLHTVATVAARVLFFSLPFSSTFFYSWTKYIHTYVAPGTTECEAGSLHVCSPRIYVYQNKNKERCMHEGIPDTEIVRSVVALVTNDPSQMMATQRRDKFLYFRCPATLESAGRIKPRVSVRKRLNARKVETTNEETSSTSFLYLLTRLWK